MRKNNAGQALQAAKAKIVSLEKELLQRKILVAEEVVQLKDLMAKQTENHERYKKHANATVKDLSDMHEMVLHDRRDIIEQLSTCSEQMKLWRLGAVVGGILTLGYTAAFFIGGM